MTDLLLSHALQTMATLRCTPLLVCLFYYQISLMLAYSSPASFHYKEMSTTNPSYELSNSKLNVYFFAFFLIYSAHRYGHLSICVLFFVQWCRNYPDVYDLSRDRAIRYAKECNYFQMKTYAIHAAIVFLLIDWIGLIWLEHDSKYWQSRSYAASNPTSTTY